MFDDLMVEIDEMMKTFDDMISKSETTWRYSTMSDMDTVTTASQIDVFISKDTVYLDIALPGFTKEEISVDVKNTTLTITALRGGGVSGGSPKIIRRKSQIVKERVNLSWRIDPNIHDIDNMDAILALGILHIKIPFKKVEESKPIERKVEIRNY